MKLRNPFKKTYSAAERNLFRFLRRSQLFSCLDEAELAELYPYFYHRTFKKNEVIFFREDPAQAVYIVREGRVELNIDIQDTFEVLAYAEEGITLGSEAFLPKKRRLYNAIVASEEAQILVLPQVNILEVFRRETAMKAKLMEALASMYADNTGHIFNAYRNVFGFFDLGKAYMYSFQKRTQKEEDEHEY
ncbi:CRP-like cAMP-binding protein [Thermonema lapsum]|uniref:CRP-like cAMP-binding protein n=1 Tax=Thermonema lapsum TaxID=28195 RepID=A0A846MN10_9BACT|nr:cyclic nucleotide-binding domain-containing protein [Thermonema lapsum]NIK72802.1 CRP-like cAMP-binding protein [Thermonema lapsum]